MKQLPPEELEKVLIWVDAFELSKSRKAINRDFSDAVLVAEILKKIYPKLVDLHNYPPRNAFTLKFDNWSTLNKKVLKKLGLYKNNEILHQLCQATPGAIEYLFFEIMKKYKLDQANNKLSNSSNDEPNENTDIMSVNIEKKVGSTVEHVTQKMVTYSLYEKSQKTVFEQQQAIAILTQKIDHLDNLLKLKCQRIDDLLGQLARKSRRLKVESEFAGEPNRIESSRSTY